MTLRILLLGSGDVGSAVAHRLFLLGNDVVLADVAAPAHPRRGMAFADAWFDGTATLEGVVAQMVPNASALAECLQDVDAIAGTSATPAEIAAALPLDVVVDARMRKRDVPEDLRAMAPVVIGLGPGFTPGANCTIAIETAWGDRLGDVLREASASRFVSNPRPLGGAGRERFVYAEEGGVWSTDARIGDSVLGGMQLGTVAGRPVHAPLSGALRGLTRSGVAVRAAQRLVEVDPSGQPATDGLGARPMAIAAGMARALGFPAGLEGAFFGFEAEFLATLDCMPMSLRLKLDRCRLKLALEQWRALPRPVRETLLEAPADTPRRVARMAQLLHRQGERLGWLALPRVPVDDLVDDPRGDAIPESVAACCARGGQPPLSVGRWVQLTPLQRYALVKLSRHRSARNWQAALTEFGLVADSM